MHKDFVAIQTTIDSTVKNFWESSNIFCQR